MAAWARHEAGEGPYRAEYRVKRTDGLEVWATASAEMTYDEAGAPLKLVGALQNVTERKRGEIELTNALSRAEEGSRSKSEFLAIMSHEIRTPLNGVLGMAQAMERDKLTAAQRKRVEVIRTSGQSLLVLLNSVLDLSKIEPESLSLRSARSTSRAWRKPRSTSLKGRNGEGPEVRASDRAGRGRHLCGDSQRVGQVLYNLLSNAVKFTEAVRSPSPSSAATRSCSSRWRTPASGFPPRSWRTVREIQPGRRLGDPPFRRNRPGLAICQQLVAMMDGAITVQSEEGRGSTFSVTLPLPRLRAGGATAESRCAGPRGEVTGAVAPLRFSRRKTIR